MTRPRIKYRANFSGTRKIMTSPEMAEIMRKRAESAKTTAEAIAPRDSGDYAGAFKVRVVRRGGPRKNRAEARLYNDVPYADDVERRHHVLGTVVDYIERGL